MCRHCLYLPALLLVACVQVPEDALDPLVAPADDADAAALFPLAEADAGRPPTAEPYAGPECETVHGDLPMESVEEGDAPVLMPGAPAAGDTVGGEDTGGDGDGDLEAGGSSEALPPARPGDVLVTELMTNPDALPDGMGEWIELHNPGDAPLDLGGCVLIDGDQERALPAGLLIEAGAYLVLARADAPGLAPAALVAFTLNNGSDRIGVRCGGVEIDLVAYGSDHPLAAGASLSLSGDALDDVLNDDPTAWCLGAEPYAGDLGTPGAPNPSCTSPTDADAGS
jgi:hypothetical protein